MGKFEMSAIGLDILDQVRFNDIKRFDEKMEKREMELDKTERAKEQPTCQWDFGLDDGGYYQPSVPTRPTMPSNDVPAKDVDEFLKGSGLKEE